MRHSKYLVLFAALLVGLPLASAVNATDVASVTTEIAYKDGRVPSATAPVAGIGDTLYVDVTVNDFVPDDGMQVINWLGTSTTSLLSDGSDNSLTIIASNTDAVATQTFSAALAKLNTVVDAGVSDAVDITGAAPAPRLDTATTATLGPVWAEQRRAAGIADQTSSTGDAASVAVSSPTEGTTLFRFCYVIGADWRSVADVLAYAVVRTPTATGIHSEIKASTTGPTVNGVRATHIVELQDDGDNNINASTGTLDQTDILGTPVQVDNFAGTNSYYVAGISDTLVFKVKTLSGTLTKLLSDKNEDLEASITADPTGTVKLTEAGVLKVDDDFIVTRASGSDQFRVKIHVKEGWGANANADVVPSGTLQVYIRDIPSNNSSNRTSIIASGDQPDSPSFTIIFDGIKPVIVAADINKVAGNFVPLGRLNAGFTLTTPAKPDVDALTYTNTNETLSQLVLTMTKADGTTVTATFAQTGNSSHTHLLGKDQGAIAFDFSGGGVTAYDPDGTLTSVVGTIVGTLPTAAETVSIGFTPTDAGGNPGDAFAVAGLIFDPVIPLGQELLPGAQIAGQPSIGPAQIAAKFTFKQIMSTASVVFKHISGSGGTDVTVSITGAGLLNISSLQTIHPTADGQTPNASSPVLLVNANVYNVILRTADASGNRTEQESGDQVQFQLLSEVPDGASYTLTLGSASEPVNTGISVTLATLQVDGLTQAFGYDRNVNINATFSAVPSGSAQSVGLGSTCTYDNNANLTDLGGGLAQLLGGSGAFDVTCTGAGTLTIGAVEDGQSTVYGQSAAIVYAPGTYAKLMIHAGASYSVGEEALLNVSTRDAYDNFQASTVWAEISTSAHEVRFPSTAIKVVGGLAGFEFASHSVGDLSLWIRDINTGFDGSAAISITGVPAVTSVTGGDVADDQGNFIYLTIDGVANGGLVRVWRDVPGLGWVSYATVIAPAGGGDFTIIVYTPDSVATKYQVTVEIGNNASPITGAVAAVTTKQAFASIDGIDSPYELMAETMMRSKQATDSNTIDAPIFATLTPDAIAMFGGVAPSFKAGDGVFVSDAVQSEPIRAIDNIAPAAVAMLKAVDTPSDAGGSITVTWNRSVDDQLLTQNVNGLNTTTVAGVSGYNVYRKIGAGEFDMAGSVAAGITSFDDNTVFNAQRYTYAVSPFDADNVAPAELERTSMAIRNNVKDASGNFVMGLFGADNSVGFDDFFIFADFFGQTAADVAFDPAFDLNPNNRIDLDDFFVFADYFGRGVESAGRVVPMLAGLNSEASLTLEAGEGLPGIGEEMTIAVDLEDFVELRGYGLSLSYDPAVLEFVGSKVEDHLLGEAALAQPQVISGQDGKASIIAYGETAVDGDLGLSLVFRAKIESEGSYIEITDGQLRDGTYGVNDLRGPVSVMIETRPEVYALNDNYPNPFNPETTIKYQLPEAGLVTLEVYNMLGQVVRTLVNEHQTAGRYSVQWDAANDNGQSLSSGMYFYHVTAGQEFQSTKKMLLLK